MCATGLSGCYKHNLCGEAESCDYDDNDCDRTIDEDFLNEDGIYFTEEHCGACGVSCGEVFPNAEETTCLIQDGAAICTIVSCPEGWHLNVEENTCAPDVPSLCVPCTTDADCRLYESDTLCRAIDADETRCVPSCDAGCPTGFSCDPTGVFCTPDTGECGCTEDNIGVTFGCLFERDPQYACAGLQVCEIGGFSECQPALEEVCNERDDDCDGGIDETFRDDEGRYIDRLNCGGCAIPCVEPGENMVAECLPSGASVTCEIDCQEGFVDVDGILANGCECERFDGMGPPPSIGGDTDCDGLPDDTDDFIFVTTMGNDRNPGTLLEPVRTIANAISKGQSASKDVLVARGIYDQAFELVAGVSVFGGYRPDFRDRDLTLFPVTLENAVGQGTPVIRCNGISQPTRIEGFTIQGSDATAPGEGSTTIYSNGCTDAVSFADITVFAGRGADGIRGDSSSDNLAEIGLSSLSQLDGVDGRGGLPGTADGFCSSIDGGAAGVHMCPSGSVAGGSGGGTSCPNLRCTNGLPCGNAGCTSFTINGVCDFDAVLRSAVPNGRPGDGAGNNAGRAGEQTYNAPTNRGVCNFCDDNPTLPRTGQRGGDGSEGNNGAAGQGCNSDSLLLDDGRVVGLPGSDGSAGSDGSGGGGGSAGSGYAIIDNTTGSCGGDRAGGSGGGAGSGGCGAPRAEGGTGGGSSVGFVIRGRGTGPSFEMVRIVTASGGDGGDGGVGAAGGAPGVGALGGTARFWCARNGGRGGDGGKGGAAGGGGGGCGGGSHAVLAVGVSTQYSQTLSMSLQVDEAGSPGRGGTGGFSPTSPAGAGRDGSAQAILAR